MPDRVIQSFRNTKTRIVNAKDDDGILIKQCVLCKGIFNKRDKCPKCNTKLKLIKITEQLEGPLEENRVKPLLTFKLIIEVPFSVCTTERIADDLRRDIANLNRDFSDVCKNEILFKKLKIRNKSDFDMYFSDSINLAKDKIYKDLQISRKNSYSNFIVENLIMFVDKNKPKKEKREKKSLRKKIDRFIEEIGDNEYV